jgi:glycosyltransferase involved in cell wall biosynthesis
MVRLLVLVDNPAGLSPGQRFRLEQWASYLEEGHGIHLDFAPFVGPQLAKIIYGPGHTVAKGLWMVRDTWRRRHVVADARDYDGVVVHREAAMLGPALYERLLFRAGLPLIFDFDDAIWIQNSGAANGVFSYLRFAGKIAANCRMAKAVVAGNEYLASYARRYSKHVFVVPTSIELGAYPVQPALRDDAPFTIVWSGSRSTLTHLEVARAALEAFGAQRRAVLRIIGNVPPERPFVNLKNEFIPWREADEASTLAAAHVGIMPLPDDEYARGKCALKGLQYMAVGLPVLLSPVGVNAEVVQNGQNGLLASSPDEWIHALQRLADSPVLRRDLGAAGRRTVEQRYSAAVSAEKFAEAVRHALGGVSVPPESKATTPSGLNRERAMPAPER